LSPSGTIMGPFGIPLEALTKHACIFGITGSGKSTTAKILAHELCVKGVSTLILDRTGEYAHAMVPADGAQVLTPGKTISLAIFHRDKTLPLSTQIEEWVSLLNHFTHVTHASALSPLQERIARDILGQYYNGTNAILTISQFMSKLEQYEERFRHRNGWEESIEALISRLWPLTADLIGETLDRPFSSVGLDEFLAPNLNIIDLSVLPDDGARNLLSQLILKQLRDKVRSMGPTAKARLVVIVDEAQHLAPNSSYVSLPEACAIELRKFGFSIVMIASRPSLISSNIIANSGMVMTHLLTNARDVETIVSYSLTSSPDVVGKIIRRQGPGEAVVQVNHPRPMPATFCSVGNEGHRALFGLPSLLEEDRASRFASTLPAREQSR
jgi:DNA helicase HerA-like ATPase